MTNMTSNRPYLIRAIYDWIVDNQLTPYILVNADYPEAQVPTSYVENGRIVLDISPQACRGLHLENDKVVFTARFGGEPVQISVGPGAVLAIYAKENGSGMEFALDDPNIPVPVAQIDAKSRKPALSLVKKDQK